MSLYLTHKYFTAGHQHWTVVPSPDGQLGLGVDLIGVVEPGVVEVVADAGRQEDTDVSLAKRLVQTTAVYQDVHHLGHTERVAEVVEWIVPIVLLDPQQESEQIKTSPSDFISKNLFKVEG